MRGLNTRLIRVLDDHPLVQVPIQSLCVSSSPEPDSPHPDSNHALIRDTFRSSERNRVGAGPLLTHLGTFHPQSIMSAPRPVHPASGAEDQLAPETPAVADQGVENLNIVDGESSSDGEMSTESSTTPGQETLHLQGQLSASSSLARQGRGASNSSSSQSNCVDIGFHIGSRVDVNALVHNHLEAAGEEIKIIDFILDFVAWISNSDFLRLQQPEPKVGDR